jgi:hypothetical protein
MFGSRQKHGYGLTIRQTPDAEGDVMEADP